MLSEQEYMKIALQEAEQAAAEGEVPIGAVIVDSNGVILARAHNTREKSRMATAHAELLAIEEACRKKNTWRLDDCSIYVTLEPCPMCAGGISNARILNLIYGAGNQRFGACGGLLNLFAYPLESIPKITADVMKEECLALMKSFFASRRNDLPYQKKVDASKKG